MEENIMDAMQIAFGILVFLVAMSTSIFLLNRLKNTAKFVYVTNNRPKYFQMVGFFNENDKIRKALDKGLNEKLENKIVTKLTLEDMINRYFKENLSISIYNSRGELNQVFDLNLENAVTKIGGIRDKDDVKKYDLKIREMFADPSKTTYLFTSPWRGGGIYKEKEMETKARIDYYINGQRGFINGIEVDYTKNGRDWFSKLSNNTLFKEIVIRYQSSGDVSSKDKLDSYGEDLINGVAPIEKVEIIYKELSTSEIDKVTK